MQQQINIRCNNKRCNNKTTSVEDYEGKKFCKHCNFSKTGKLCHMIPCFNFFAWKIKYSRDRLFKKICKNFCLRMDSKKPNLFPSKTCLFSRENKTNTIVN